MRLYIHFRSDTSPHGGGNSFLSDFWAYCLRSGVDLARSINDGYDILLASGGYQAPGVLLDLQELLHQKHVGRSGAFRFLHRRRRGRILVYRADGFRCIYAGLPRDCGDTVQRCCLHMADHVILQNRWSAAMLQDPRIDYHASNYTVIHNGVDQAMFNTEGKPFWNGQEPLRIFSASWSSNPNKGHAELAAMSRETDTEVTFCGNWPKGGVDPARVRVLPPLPRARLALEYRKHHVFMLVSRHDTSPNACLEAVSCGLPVVYHADSGVREMMPDCGLAYGEGKPDVHTILEQVRTRYRDLVQTVLERRAYFSMDRCGAEYVRLFESLAEGGAGDGSRA